MSAFAGALDRSEITLATSSLALQDKLGLAEERLRLYRAVLREADNARELSVALHAAAATAASFVDAQTVVGVAWTFPGTARPGLRTTGGTARDIIESSCRSLLVVGYSVTVDPALTGLAAQTVSAMARAGSRGVIVTAVLHRDVSPEALLRAWDTHGPRPAVFTWPESGDPKASIHAKLIVADRTDALVTSANLTYHGLERNIEMGVRIRGPEAAEIHDRFHELIAARVLVPWHV